MNPFRASHRRPAAVASAVVSLAMLTSLAGCSATILDILGPPTKSLDAARSLDASEIQAPPPLIERWESPRITIRTDGWRAAQKEGGVSLEASRIYDLEVLEQQPLAFEWSARPKNGQGEIQAYRWALDIEDIADETPRIGPDDLAHWSAWSATEQSATIGPFAGASHLFHVETRDNLGFLSLVTVRLNVVAASEAPLAKR